MSGRVTVINALAQLVGFALFSCIAYLYGTTAVTDAFFLALAVPTLVIGPVVNSIHSVFVPLITSTRVRAPEQVSALAGAALGWVLVLGGLGGLVMALGAPIAVSFMRIPESLRGEVVRQTWILAPLVALLLASGILQAILNADGQFVRPSLAFAARHGSALVALFVLRPVLGGDALATAFVLGAAIQCACLASQVRGSSIAVRPLLTMHASFRRSLRMAVPLVGSSAVLQGAAFALRAFASVLPPGSITVLDYTMRITSAVIELVGSGVLVVAMVNWSQLVAQGLQDRLRVAVRDLLSLAVLVLVPIAVLLGALSDDIVRVALGHGRMSLESQGAVAGVLTIAALAIPIEIVARLYLRLLLARHETSVLFKLAIARLVVLAACALALRGPFGVAGLIGADLLSLVVYAVILGAIAGRGLDRGSAVPWPRLLRLIGSGALMWWIAVLTRGALSALPPIAATAVAGLMAVAVFAAITVLFGDARPLLDRLTALRSAHAASA